MYTYSKKMGGCDKGKSKERKRKKRQYIQLTGTWSTALVTNIELNNIHLSLPAEGVPSTPSMHTRK